MQQLIRIVLSVFMCLILTAFVCRGSTFIANAINPNDISKCYWGRAPNILEIDVGKSKRLPRACCVVNCRSDLTVSGTCCGSRTLNPDCFLTEPDLSLDYPDCCPRMKCPNEV